jgi:hypothetical protein
LGALKKAEVYIFYIPGPFEGWFDRRFRAGLAGQTI